MELIPDNFSSWVAEARKNNALHLKDSGWKSASKFDRPSYLSLRTVWKTKYQSNFSPKNWGITQTTRARKLLENISGWPLYLDHVDKRDIPSTLLQKDTRREGDCSVSVLEQELRRLDIQREQETTPEPPIDRMSPTSPISSELANGLYPPVIDEQIVNTALIIFLNAISIECYGMEAEWPLHRKSFKFGQHFEAETDGHLSIFDKKGSLSRAIVEVKPTPNYISRDCRDGGMDF
ncbi:uncharacterized protein BDCG_05002 [Blastomyces dermatitidis ER-3]|uniref:Uncharacterized protein n=1 Tax=Ajellomyces dermatitidis (strain ER-3 / ATCC MYA-2586) TaxID=559297 RepID=A0ABM9YHW9_AJEDR|nr:uncharacterized protein BDCG_05002 [Blastomyces dermatitidis ER-3]EEQ89882.2 hypothetical protein BDCG_05002 [Blastomyces dermatitidis ER-3]